MSGGRKTIKNIFTITAKHPGTQPLLEAKDFGYYDPL